MLDFVRVAVVTDSKGNTKVEPDYLTGKSKDLMIRGGAFYAVWDEAKGLWSTDESDVQRLVDEMVLNKRDELVKSLGESSNVRAVLLKNYSTKKWREWKQYVKDSPDNWHALDANVLSADAVIKKEDYASKTLPYVIAEGSTEAYTKLSTTLYDLLELQKFEWFLGAVLTGASKKLQKFIVLYGPKGTGKSTMIDIACELLKGYWSPIEAKILGMSKAAFPLEQFSSDPLLGVDHEAKLSKIDDNTRINSIVAHNAMMVNEKFKKPYPKTFKTALMFGSNDPVKITDLKSGLLRRMIDINPSRRLVPSDEYTRLVEQIQFEYGAIAYHCMRVYKKLGFSYYNNYIPRGMLNETNEFYNFVIDKIDFFEKNSDMLILKTAYGQYKSYCEDANVRYPYDRTAFKNELKNYFETYVEKSNGFSNVFRGFKDPTIRGNAVVESTKEKIATWLTFSCTISLLDDILSDCPAQGCKDDGSPRYKWANVRTKLKDIDTRGLHWVKPMSRLICIDFDILGPDGTKDLDANVAAASKWPPTYAEVSKSGKAIHLYYYYDGDVSKLSSMFAPYIEIKTFTGDASLRRMVTKCNDLPIATISSNLPLKGDTMTSWDGIKDEKHLYNMIAKALCKKVHDDTTSNIHFIKDKLDQAYEMGLAYKIPQDMIDDIRGFAENSTNQSEHCCELVSQMHFEGKASKPSLPDDAVPVKDDRIVFFDIEIKRPDPPTNNPGLFLICWKFRGADTVTPMVNPSPLDVEFLVSNYKLAGFNCRAYDNPMLHGAIIGFSNQRLYDLSQHLIVDHERIFPESANYSYIDVFDMCTEKMSLKRWEIKLKKPHREHASPWDEPAPPETWNEIIEYCMNDVRATEAVFEARQEDFQARQFQVMLVGILHPDDNIDVCVNDTTNTLSKRIVFGKETRPQGEFNWRDLSQPVGSDRYEEYLIRFGKDYRFRVFDSEGLPLYRDYVPGEVLPDGYSILPFFPGYTFEKENGTYVSRYLGEVIGEGGRVDSVPGYYTYVVALDISSQHPSSMDAEVVFGPAYQRVVHDLRALRVAIKHRDYEAVGKYFNGALAGFVNDENAAGLAQALKIVINSIYGLTKAGFNNEFRDPNNVDNIVAKRGALFMTLLKREVEKRGAFVCHIKTDCVKIPNCSDEVKDFVVRFGKEYGYDFEVEDVFVKFGLFNDAAYVGLTEDGEWKTKADQFKKEKQPYLYKTLFSHQPYEFDDFCETKSVSKGALYLDMNEDLGEPVEKLLESKARKLSTMRKKRKEKLRPLHPELSEVGLDALVNEETDILELNNECVRLHLEAPSHHNYQFVGRVGQFTPILPGKGGGVLYRKEGDTLSAATGSKGYRWLESEYMRDYGMHINYQDVVDISYYRKRVDAAKDLIEKTVRESTNGEYGCDYFLSNEIPEKHLIENFGEEFMNKPE